MISRREFALLTAGLAAPGRVLGGGKRRSASAADRKFLFLFNDGGWDTGYAFTDFSTVIDAGLEEGAEGASVGDIHFVDHPDRPSIRDFFQTYGPQTALINGIEVRSVTHERCRQLMLTGQGALADDWSVLLAGRSTQSLLLPHVVIDGPAFSNRFTSDVIRVGDASQLPALLSGEALVDSDRFIELLPANIESIADNFVAQRAAQRGDDFGQAYVEALDRIEDMKTWSDLDLSLSVPGCERDLVADAGLAFSLFEAGITRTAMLRYKGWCSEGWDTHQGLEKQGRNFGDLFTYLTGIMEELSGRVSHTGAPLSEEVTIVVFSEMGREPRLNSWGGRDHWTFTSAMLVGSGIQGGQTIGALDAYGQGHAVDLGTGAIRDGGTALLPEHLGATLLTLGDVDPAEFLESPGPITAVIS
jgi:hypothetical protein